MLQRRKSQNRATLLAFRHRSIEQNLEKCRKQLKEVELAHGKYHKSSNSILEELGRLLLFMCKYEQALPLLHQRLVILEQSSQGMLKSVYVNTIQEIEDEIAQGLHDVGIAYRYIGNLDVAEQHLLKALEKRKQHFGTTHGKISESYNSLAILYQLKGMVETAETMHGLALQNVVLHVRPEDDRGQDIPFEIYKIMQLKKSTPAILKIATFKLKLKNEIPKLNKPGKPTELRYKSLKESALSIHQEANLATRKARSLSPQRKTLPSNPSSYQDAKQKLRQWSISLQPETQSITNYNSLLTQISDIRESAFSSKHQGTKTVQTKLQKLTKQIALISDNTLQQVAYTMLSLLKDTIKQ